MSDKRNRKRGRKRIALKFGPHKAERVAFSEDLSLSGMFIRTPNAAPIGSIINIDLAPEGAECISMQARVMWAKKVPPNLFHLVRKCGMGVQITRFLSGEESYRALVAPL